MGELSSGLRARVVSAWAGALGAAVGELRAGERALVEHDDAVIAAEIDRFTLVAAPSRFWDALRAAPREVLLDADALAGTLPEPVRALGTADLLFAAEPEAVPGPVEYAAASDVEALRAELPVSEWEESGIGDAERIWMTSACGAGSPDAIAGFTPWRAALAHIAVASAPRSRGRGHARVAASAAARAAARDGLVPQWRSRRGHAASRRLAESLGFSLLGTQVAVAVDA